MYRKEKYFRVHVLIGALMVIYGATSHASPERSDNRVHQAIEVRVAHPDRVGVRAGVEDDLRVGAERLIDEHWLPVERAEGRHDAPLAVAEEVAQLGVGGQADGAAQRRRQGGEVDVVRGR